MLTSEMTIADYAQRRRVLGRRADIRLARALRHSVPLHRKVRHLAARALRMSPRRIHARLQRSQLIRQWKGGSFVETLVTLPRAA
ncbi:MAG: hypothetical protein KDK53_21450 [Maritimibacter sp.]|nr:hypothetical protein [Maritimibacter sp.]